MMSHLNWTVLLAAVVASFDRRSARGDRRGKGRRVPALDLAAIAPRSAEACDLLAYLDAAGVTGKASRRLPRAWGVARGDAKVIRLPAHTGWHGRRALGVPPSGNKAEIVPLRHDA